MDHNCQGASCKCADPYGVPKLCSIEDCDNPRVGRGWCRKHYRRWQRHGDPLFTPSSPFGGSIPGAGRGRKDNPRKLSAEEYQDQLERETEASIRRDLALYGEVRRWPSRKHGDTFTGHSRHERLEELEALENPPGIVR
jgi:hypothetical protein